MEPRLHVLSRPETNNAVIIRWGPSQVFCTIGWDQRTDRFSVGQWCKHKLYPQRCDISPDGGFLVYFALNGQWDSETAGSWTALSRAPYLKALKLWPQGDTWGGGGLFLSAEQLPEGHPLDRQPPLPRGMFLVGGDYARRLQRDGWQTKPRKFVKRMQHGWSLRKIVRGEPRELHALLDRNGQVAQALPTWQWADWDARRERIVWAEAGVLHAARLDETGIGKRKQLFDARGMAFKAIPAPYRCRTVIVKR